MPSILVFDALIYGLIGLLAITFVALALLALISLGKDARTGEPLKDLFPFALVIATLCVLISLLTA
jgi:hypothetical protein